MTDEAFAAQELTPHGKALLRHMGEHVARETAALGSDPCTRPSALFIADDSKRDQQSAEAFASGFYPNACAAARTVDIVVANESNGLTPTTSDDTQTGECPAGPDERGLGLLIGQSTAALTDLYRPQLRQVGELIGCCGPAVCAAYGLSGGGSCQLDELPYEFNGLYWEGLYQGPLSAADYFIEAWMLEALSGAPPAGGRLSTEELRALYALHMRLMWISSNHNRSQAVGSHLLGFLLTSLEEIVSGETRPGGASAQLAGRIPRLLAIFAHDFNLLYLRTLLGASWITPSWPFDVAATGASVSLELHREIGGEIGGEVGGEVGGGYRVLGVMTAATMEQQSSASSLLHTPPSRAIFLDEPYDDFKARALGGLRSDCVVPPLRATIERLVAEAEHRPMSLTLTWGAAAAVGVLFFVAGGAGGLIAMRAARLGGGQRAGDDGEATPVTPILRASAADAEGCGGRAAAEGSPSAARYHYEAR